MKKILLLASLSLLSITGCGTKQVKLVNPPNFKRLNQIREEFEVKGKLEVQDISEELALKYFEAQKLEMSSSPSSACSAYEQIADKPEFPLGQVALIKTLLLCDLSKHEVKKIWENTNPKNYLKESFLEAMLNISTRLEYDEMIFQVSLKSIETKSPQSEKLKLLNLASEAAKRLNNSDYILTCENKLREVAPRHNLEITNANMYSIAKDFEQARQFENARSLYLQIINGDFKISEKVKAYNAYRLSFKVSRDLKTFLEKTKEMEEFFKNLQVTSPQDQEIAEAWVESKINYARAIWTEHFNKEARLIIEDLLATNLGTDNQKAQALSVYGGLYLEIKENSKAIRQYEKAANLKITNQDLQETIEWSLVWNYFLSKSYKKVLSHSQKFIEKSINPNFIAKLQYWNAKTLQALGRSNEAHTLFSALTLKDQFGYYGLLASLEIQSPLTPIKMPETILLNSGNSELEWLIGVGEKQLGAKYLKTINSQFKTYKDRESAFPLYLATEWFQGGMSQVLNFPIQKRDELTIKYIDVVYPKVFENIFRTYSQKYEVPLAYSLAITRQESGFNPLARSWADAFGLMQMIPENAKKLSSDFSIPYKDFNDLYKPETNIQMGVAFLSQMRHKFQSQFINTTASYNASSAAIATWEKERFNGNYIEFIEMIPYEETRNYIKLVFRNYITYRRILSDREFTIPKNFFNSPF